MTLIANSSSLLAMGTDDEQGMKGRKYHLLMSLAFSCLLFGHSVTGASLEELQVAFQKRYDQSVSSRDEQLAKLRENYLTALGRQFDKTKAKGKLELLLPIKDQMDAIEAGRKPLPELSPNATYELKQLRDTFAKAEEKIQNTGALELLELAKKMEQVLSAKESALTKAGEVDEALKVKNSLNALKEDEILLAARAQLNPSLDEKPWISLTESKWKVLESGSYWIGDAKGVNGSGGGYDSRVSGLINKIDDQGFPHFVAVPPAKIEFRLSREATMLETTAWMAWTGDVKIKIFGGGEEPIAEFDVSHPNMKEKKLDLKFEPTKRITIEIEPNGSINNDWAVLLSPSYR